MPTSFATLVYTLVLLSCWSSAQAAAPAGEWWNTSYAYRQKITVTTTTAAAVNGYSVSITVDHAALVTASKSLASGNDMRIAYWNGTSWVELDRLLDDSSSWNSTTTKIWFKTQSAIAASSSNDNYYLYYSNASAGSPPANGLNIFLLYDTFSGNSLDTTLWSVPSGTASVSGGILTVDPNSRVWANAAYAFGTGTRWDARGRYNNGNSSGSARNIWGANECNGIDNQLAPGGTAGATCDWMTFYRSAAHRIDMATDVGYQQYSYTLSNPTSYHLYTFDRVGTTTVNYYIDSSSVRSVTGGPNYLSTINLRALMYSQDTSPASYLQYDWVRVRHYVEPEPTTALAAEEALSALSHFSISHSGSAVTCQAEAITIAAHNAGHSVVTTYTGTITLSTTTSRGDWSLQTGNGTLTNAGNGSATYTFVAADNGQVVLGLKDTYVETTNINSVSGAVTEYASEDANLVVSESGFRFLADGAASSIGTQIAGKASNVAPGAQTLQLQAIRTSTQTGACTTALSGNVTVGLAFECTNPTSCAGNLVNISGSNIAANASGSVSSYTNVSLNFGTGAANFTLSYSDAGAIRLHARYNIPLGSGVSSGNLMTGSSNTFVVRPFAFALDFSGDRAANGTSGISYAASSTGGRYKKAGESFAASVTAVGWQAADDTNNDGAPDTGANLYDNTATPNFGRETSAATVTISPALVLPAGGTLGSVTGGSGVGGYTSGATSTNLSYSEVGIIDLTATHSSYLASGSNITGTVSNVGRFYPDKLALSTNTPTFRNGPDSTWACNFTYQGQSFTFATAPAITLTAKNVAGATTNNYGGSFWKLTSTPYLSNRSYASTATGGTTLDAPATGTVALTGDSDYDGAGTLTVQNDTFLYQRTTTPVAPFNASATLTLTAADLTDSDGVCYQGAGSTCTSYALTGITGGSRRFGRLQMQNVSGSELTALSLPAQTEDYTGTGYVTNTDDNCTSITTARIDLSSASSDPAQGTTSVAVGGGTSTASIASTPMAAGDAGLAFSAPGAGNTGYVGVSLNLTGLGWLMFDWDGDGAHDDNPSARATFGIYAGSKPMIYVREPWN